MGSCLSVTKAPDSAVELRLSVGSNLSMPSTVKQEVDTVNGGDRAVADLAPKPGFSSRFHDAGSKDDAFFDTQPWLESDGEDDFLSVNGDFTPSRGSTPLHHKFLSENPKVNNASVLEESYLHEQYNPDKKKRLSELFKESFRRQDYTDYDTEENFENVKSQEATDGNEAKSVDTPDRPIVTENVKSQEATYGNEAKSVDTPDRPIVAEDDKRVKSTQCCLPSFGERKKKISSVIVNG